ncbi:hypothetical protein [Mucilaginibacter sp.]|uniref:hypothetical protein n=1 Tax=Mucilaginibacter sp. TaxID=1882438 RepID=UPI000CB4E9DF|nr:hypothetical protein [Mucilaginibacter sp.]PLW89977.1 MAG: hypothetical protein C0154_08620 [Mucilaginibacter sp.]PMP65771.1 MAG: hypothetical protein C0191_02610 [Mucilaginibacter sp.]
MLRLSSYIKITDPSGTNYLEFTFLNEVEIEKSRRSLTNTAKVTIARKLKILNGDINQILKRGSAIEIQLGYDGNLKTMFSGFVTEVGAKTPVVIDCQDEMWSLKQNSFTKAWSKKVKVSEIIKYVYSGPAQIVDLEIGGFIIKKESTAQALDKLRKYGLQCYFDKGILIVDFAGVIHNQGKEVIYDFNKNIVENNLEYKRKEDARIKVIGISKEHKGKKLEVIAGDNDGEVHTLHYTNMDKDQLQKIVNSEIDKLKYNGFKGNFKTFGLPYIEPGDTAVLLDQDYPEHQGSYLVESVKTNFSVDGYRHEPELERKTA